MLQKNTKASILFFFLSLFVLIQPGCKKPDSMDDTQTLEPPVVVNDATKVTATISGSVIDENNQPVVNATVTSDSYSGTTDAMGNFTFKNVNISAANGHVTVIKTGYFKGIRSFVTMPGKNNYVKIQLLKQTLTATLIASAGGTVTTNGASIVFPANAFVTSAGAAYNGSVKVFAYWIDPTAANLPLVIPGDLRGINSSNGEYLLTTYGMVGAELQDASGNTLKIAPGKKATISFPIPAMLAASAPETIALWHFDEATARWKEEGTATKSGSNYTAAVDKFSFWNVDVPGNFVTLDLRLLNSANSLPMANTMVKITRLSNGTYVTGFTNDSGYVSGYVPKNENLKLEVITNTFCTSNTVVYTQNIGPYTANASLGNINVTIPATQVITFTGTVKNCNNQPVTNGYVSLSLAGGGGTIAYTNATGQVNFSLLYCGGTATYTYNAVDLSTGAYSTVAGATAIGNTVNLGTLTACGNTINTSGVYITGAIENNAVLWKDGIATVLTNIPANGNKSAYALQALVYNNDVYVLGSEEDTTINGWVNTIKLWKNGVLTNVTNGLTYAEPFGFDVYNGDVYIVGLEGSGSATAAKVWKNGVATIIPKDTFDILSPTSIKVVNGDVYVSGKVFSNSNSSSRAVYWKNNTINFLSAASVNAGNEASGIFIDNGDLYFSGSESTSNGQSFIAVYWKNAVKTTLTYPGTYAGASSNSIFVDNGDIYIGGSIHQNQGVFIQNAVYWKNNNINFVTNYATSGNTAAVNNIFVKNNIVYTVGEINSNNGITTPLYFQNNVPVALTGFTNTQEAYGYGIFVK
ncbi:carboxypeptidase regulatory-like domain-containing protein [Ferruginibacter sp.]